MSDLSKHKIHAFHLILNSYNFRNSCQFKTTETQMPEMEVYTLRPSGPLTRDRRHPTHSSSSEAPKGISGFSHHSQTSHPNASFGIRSKSFFGFLKEHQLLSTPPPSPPSPHNIPNSKKEKQALRWTFKNRKQSHQVSNPSPLLFL